MFGIGGFELFLILVFGFLIFGPDKLPAIAQTIGKAIAKFRGAQEDMTEQLKTATFVDKDSDNPIKNPLDVIESAAADAKKKGAAARAKADAATEKVSQAAEGAGVATGVAAASAAESFAERKARYDRERAARKKAEAEAAAAQAADEQAAASAAAEAAANPTADVAAKQIVEEED